jgi:hypothetical protein
VTVAAPRRDARRADADARVLIPLLDVMNHVPCPTVPIR